MLNKNSMLKNGTIAVMTMIGTYLFFGVENIMLAFPIALTSAVLGRQNYNIKIYNKTLRLLLINIIIVLVAHISTLNMYTGIIINFLAIFLIVYCITMPYDATFYKPFVMLYIFTQYAEVESERLPLRILSIVFGVFIVFICNKFIQQVSNKNLLGNNIIKSLKLIKEGLIEIKKGNYSDEIEGKCTNIMRSLAYKIYVSRYKKYLTTNLGKIQFEIFVSIEYLNIYLKNIYSEYKKGEINLQELEDIESVFDYIIKVCKEEIAVEEVNLKLQYIMLKYKNKSESLKKVLEILHDIIKSIKALSKLNKKTVNLIYDKWEKSEYDKSIYKFKENFNVKNIRFKFAMRMSITLTLALFLADLLGFYKIIWAIITIMSVIQPYYEDTIKKSKDRILGNVIAIILVGTVVTLINNEIVTIFILIISLYLLYGFKEYYKISMFAAIASLCVASLSEKINILLRYRVAYIIVGLIIVLISNKYLFPYRVENGINQLKDKITRYKNILARQYKYLGTYKVNEHLVRDLVINEVLLCEKLSIRNKQYGDRNIEEFIYNSTREVVEIGYLLLNSVGE